MTDILTDFAWAFIAVLATFGFIVGVILLFVLIVDGQFIEPVDMDDSNKRE